MGRTDFGTAVSRVPIRCHEVKTRGVQQVSDGSGQELSVRRHDDAAGIGRDPPCCAALLPAPRRFQARSAAASARSKRRSNRPHALPPIESIDAGPRPWIREAARQHRHLCLPILVVEIKRMLPTINPHPPSREPVLGPRSARTRGGWVPPLPWYGRGARALASASPSPALRERVPSAARRVTACRLQVLGSHTS
jgi:hypothetical protein